MLSVTWTIVTLAAQVGKGELVKLISQAAFRRVLDLDDLLRVAHDGSRRPGSKRMREALRSYLVHDEHGSDTALEDRVAAWLPNPMDDPMRQNIYVVGDAWRYRLDIAYERARIAVEPGGPHHDLPIYRQRDKVRWRRLCAEGWKVFVIPWDEFELDPYRATEAARTAILAASTDGPSTSSSISRTRGCGVLR